MRKRSRFNAKIYFGPATTITLRQKTQLHGVGGIRMSELVPVLSHRKKS